MVDRIVGGLSDVEVRHGSEVEKDVRRSTSSGQETRKWRRGDVQEDLQSGHTKDGEELLMPNRCKLLTRALVNNRRPVKGGIVR
jgi:hypothetical protein